MILTADSNTTCRIILAIHKEHISQLVSSNLLILSWGCVVELRVMRVIVVSQRGILLIAKSYHQLYLFNLFDNFMRKTGNSRYPHSNIRQHKARRQHFDVFRKREFRVDPLKNCQTV